MSELEKTAYDRGFYNGIREARQIFAKHLNVSTSTDEIKWDNVSKNEILSEIDNFMTKNEAYPQPQLTIPKSVADEIDCVVNPIGQIVLKSGILSDFTVEAISWIYKNNENGYIAIAYANPLTRDLVKVVEG